MSVKEKNKLSLILNISGEKQEVACIDARKYELIEYYVKQSADKEKDTTHDQISALSQMLQKAFEDAIEKQYKKYVPNSVRTMYDQFLSKSVTFGAVLMDNTEVDNSVE